MAITPAQRRSIRARAKRRCEFCHFPEQFAELPFHVDHIVARQHGGGSVIANLALVCCFCNAYKGPNLSGIDPLSRKVVRLFNPRRQVWAAHFEWNGPVLIGKTAIARATIQVLQINRADAITVRQLLINEGRYPSV